MVHNTPRGSGNNIEERILKENQEIVLNMSELKSSRKRKRPSYLADFYDSSTVGEVQGSKDSTKAIYKNNL